MTQAKTIWCLSALLVSAAAAHQGANAFSDEVRTKVRVTDSRLVHAFSRSLCVGSVPQAIWGMDVEVLRGPVPPWLPGPDGGRRYLKDVRIEGVVTGVTKGYVEVLGSGATAPVRYPPHEALASGRILLYETERWSYLLDDVKVGDELTVGTGKIGDTTFSLYLSIRRRPGGKVPMSRKPSEHEPYHERQQAKIDTEKKPDQTPERLRKDLPPAEVPNNPQKGKVPDTIPKAK